jgi:hypothetical protein
MIPFRNGSRLVWMLVWRFLAASLFVTFFFALAPDVRVTARVLVAGSLFGAIICPWLIVRLRRHVRDGVYTIPRGGYGRLVTVMLVSLAAVMGIETSDLESTLRAASPLLVAVPVAILGPIVWVLMYERAHGPVLMSSPTSISVGP